MSDPQILGADGKPLKPPKTESPLPVEIQAFIEARVNTAVDAARESLRAQATAAEHDSKVRGYIKFAALSVAATLFAVLTWVFGSSEVRQLTRQYVTQHMSKPMLQQAAKEVITNEASLFVSEKLLPLSQSVSSLLSNITAAQRAIDRLQQEQQLIYLVARAEALDKEAFQQLDALAHTTNETATLASTMAQRVLRTLALDAANSTYLLPTFNKGPDSFQGPFTSEDLWEVLSNPLTAEASVNIVSRDKCTRFIPTLFQLAHDSKDLYLLNRISRAFKAMVGLDFQPVDLHPLDEWWAEHKSAYTNWPSTQYKDGNESLRRGDYAKALPSFQYVLSVDPTADQTRARAAACAAELGDLQKAEQLNTGYSQKDGPWQKWATAKIMLSRGEINAATRQLATIKTNFPVIETLLEPGNHLFRQLDWSLFAQLVAAPTNATPDAAAAAALRRTPTNNAAQPAR